MPDYASMFDNPYLASWDLVDAQGNPKDYTLEIVKVEAAELMTMGGKAKRKPILTLKGAKKKLACNKTNAASIKGMYGRNTDGWIGKSITLYPTTTTVGSEKGVPCIRIRPSKPKGESEQLPEGVGNAEGS